MKKIDQLVLTSFLPPFVVSFSIALFVLLMQMIWLYMDELAGKGLGVFMVAELLFYRSVGIIPMALPLGILLASVMTMGGLAEHYEMSSMKSAGISLLRIMRSMLIFGVFAGIFSWYCSNTLIPIANLKFGSRMFDIKQKKPALRLETGVFNDGLEGYAIHIGHRDDDGKTIHDVLIYDHTQTNSGKLTEVTAKSGELFVAEDGKYLIMRLRDGNQYVETSASRMSSQSSYPFVRTGFKEWTKVFDLSEFELTRTNEDLFKANRQMMSSTELRIAADSIHREIDKRNKEMANYLVSYFPFLPTDSTYIPKQEPDIPKEASKAMGLDSLVTSPPPQSKSVQTLRSGGVPPQRLTGLDMDTVTSLINTFPIQERGRIKGRAKSVARGILNQAEGAASSVERMRESEVKHIYELHTKYSIAVACFIFLFVGGPMGAIVRKGGFGYPILVSIIFFMIFVVLTIFCRKIAETFVLPAVVAAWLPCGVLFPMGVFLTFKAMNDSSLLSPDRFIAFVKRIFPTSKKVSQA
ncbi:MAG: LptF/LptG family permease [Lewinellaceae bacterium]|nr:LptF/LptG family permease [Lewinellaceae bacterium]